ncbi:translation initiation factor IF-2 [Candidatus Pacearchaeota archaeon]|nr:translation initiation factor IF-2 [Candidatus Pacearchaeota archaeon]
MATNQRIRQPIITVAGHVDHGKTSLLDSIRNTEIQESEAGGITQKISFTKVPMEKIEETCPLLQENKIKLDFPGFLFIDTPGHAAFSHLRKRGGSLADIAILMIDINDGIKPQTQEVIEILKLNKIPFIIALNKIDNISSWRKQSEKLMENINKQSTNTQLQFKEKLLTIAGSLHHHGFNAKLYSEITDFTKELALIPCSAKTKEGIPELILTLAGLSQRFLKDKLKLDKDAKGVVFEIKKEKSMEYSEAILYDGTLSIKDEIAIASFDEPIITKIRVLEEILPLSNKFESTKKATASTGLRMQLINNKEILPGMPFTIFKDNLEEIKTEFKKELTPFKTEEQGIIIKADSLGSLQALITLLNQEKIPIMSAGIGKINKKDIIQAKTNKENDPVNSLILGFSTSLDDEAKNLNTEDIKILTNEVIYKLIEDAKEYQNEKRKEIEKERLMELATISQLKILPQYIFRNSNPAVFGVEIEVGKLKKGIPIIDENGTSISRVKDIQEDKNSVEQAEEGKQIALSLTGTNFERQLSDITHLYSDISEKQFRHFKENKDLLTQSEIQTLQKIAEIKRKENVSWGV